MVIICFTKPQRALAQETPIPELVKNIALGIDGSDPTDFVTIGNQTFFVATTPDAGRELWKTDGTAVGTVIVKDINQGSAGSNPIELTAVGGTYIPHFENALMRHFFGG